MTKSLQNHLAYSGGEFSPLMAARIDHPKYGTACRKLQNMIALRQGGATRRPGTIFKGKAKYSDTDIRVYGTRLMPFQFSPTTSFMLEFGHEYVRFYKNKQQVTLSAAPGWDNTFAFYGPGTFVEDPTDGNAIYYCYQGLAPVGVPPSTDSAHWVKQSIYEIPSPYNGRVNQPGSRYNTDVWRIVPCQVNDLVYLVHPDYPPYVLTRFGDTNWTLRLAEFNVPPLLDQNVTGVRLAASAVSGAVVGLTASASAWATGRYYEVGMSIEDTGVIYTCITPHTSSATLAADIYAGFWRVETIFTAANVGGYFRVGHVRNTAKIEIALTANGTSAELEAVGDCEFNTYGSWAADVTLQRSDDLGITWTDYQQISSQSDHNGSIPVKLPASARFRMVVSNYSASTGSPRAAFIVVSGISWGLMKITAVTDAYNATGSIITRFFATTASDLWAEGAWSLRRGFPQAVTSFQQRLLYGGSGYEPQRIWGSVTNDIENFDLGDQSEATAAFAFDIAAVGRGRIQWMVGQSDLFIGFAGAEWIANAGDGAFGGSGEPIGPQAFNAGEHSSFGSADGIPPQLVGNAVLYTQRSARTIQQMLFSVYTNKYQSADLTALSDHLFGPGIAQFSYQPQFRQQPIVWVVTRGGALCGMTYDAQFEVNGWHRHTTINAVGSTNSRFQSVATIFGDDGEDDQVWVVADRLDGPCIELMNPVNWEYLGGSVDGVAQPLASQACYVDSCVQYTQGGAPVTAIPGFTHLTNYLGDRATVIALLNGTTVLGPAQVALDGTVTFENYEPQSNDVLQIGLPIEYIVLPMRMDVDGRAGVVMGVQKALSKVFLYLVNSLGGRVQGNGDKLIPIPYRTVGMSPVVQPTIFTGMKDVVPESTQTDDPLLYVRGTDPFPLTLLATTVRINISGSA